MEIEKYIVDGLQRLDGEIQVHGAKNAALPILAASMLCDRCELHNCPHLSDIRAACNILEHLGCSTCQEGDVITITSPNQLHCTIPEELMREMRSSIVFLGAIIARQKEAKISYPGGCELGPRPIDLHLSSLKKLGVEIVEDHGYLDCRVPDKLKGAVISLPFPSVGATENIMIAACTAEGETIIHNPAREPEITDLAGFLNTCGANIQFDSDGTIRIQGVPKLHEGIYRVIPDRIVAVTYLCCCAMAKGDLFIKGVCPEHMSAVLPILEEMGCQLDVGKEEIRIRSKQPLRAVKNITTMPYPGFPTDALAPIMSLATVAQGTTVFVENIFQNRFKQAWELVRMGADIKTEGRIAVVRGVEALHSADVCCTDLRGGAALVVAALGAQGKTTIRDVRHILRGYENLCDVLNQAGASIHPV